MQKPIGRLAMRVEGDNWVAYYALTETMEGAAVLGSIRMGIVTAHPEHKQAFMNLMQEVVADFIQESTGQRPVWNKPQGAPEHERSGRG